MKPILLLIITVAGFCSCGNSNENKPAKPSETSQRHKDDLPPGAVATSGAGWTMTAKINGKDYQAHSILLPEGDQQIIGFYDGDKYIEIPYLQKDLAVGKKIDFSNQNATLTTNDSVQVRSGDKGEMEITKVYGNWAEGKFNFTAVSYDADKAKTIEVTDGFFRIALTKPGP